MQSVNKEYIIDITDMSSEGAGIGKIDGFAVFVPFALKGEKVRIIITKMLKNYAIGQLVEVISTLPTGYNTFAASFTNAEVVIFSMRITALSFYIKRIR